MLSISKKSGALVSVFFIVVIWGSAAAVTKLAVENMPAYLFALLRNLVASLCLLAIYYFQRTQRSSAVPKPPLRKIIWMALSGITFFYLFFNISLYYTSAAAGALIQGFIPVVIIALSLVFLKERLTGLQLPGIFLSVSGVIMISFVGTDQSSRNYILGNSLMIVAVLCWGIYTIISKTLQQYDAVYITMMSTCIGTALLIPATIIELWNKPAIPSISIGGWAAILYLGVFSSAICYLLYNRVLKILSGVQVGNFMNLDPVVGALIAVFLLNEKMDTWQIAGALLVLTGVILTARKSPDPLK